MRGDQGWILVVEDEADIREILCMVLEEHGLHAVGAADGVEALQRLRERSAPELVILDLMMPRMDGWQFRDAQLHDPDLAGIPVLVLSGDGRVPVKAAELHAVGFLRKPVEIDELLSSVEHHVS
jgi:CheY-like chemotaxis protein